jgi:predicted ATPase
LVTLIGPAGTGKTRLAMEYATRHLAEFTGAEGGGAWFCDLTQADHLESICSEVARVLDVPLATGHASGDVVAQVGQALAGRGRTLLILDNCEQVVEPAAACVGRWLAMAPATRILATSREVLRVTGEACYDLAPLGVPEEGGDVGAAEAVQLFVERARAVRHGYALSEADAPHVAAIVRRLDGIPLAIELAAARVGMLSPADLLERLPRRFELLTRSQRDASARQATLRAAIDWSWDLLRPWEQAALAQCAVFHGGFSPQAAEAVLDLSGFPDAPLALDVVQALRDKSLLRAYESDEFPGEARLGMYLSIHDYAAEKLEASGEATAARARHASYYLGVGLNWQEGVDRHGGVARLRRLAQELENLGAVYRWSVGEGGSPTQALQALVALDPVLSTRGPFDSHLAWLDAALDLVARAQGDPLLHAQGLEARGRARQARGQMADARRDYEEALSLVRAKASCALEARACGGKGGTAANRNET